MTNFQTKVTSYWNILVFAVNKIFCFKIIQTSVHKYKNLIFLFQLKWSCENYKYNAIHQTFNSILLIKFFFAKSNYIIWNANHAKKIYHITKGFQLETTTVTASICEQHWYLIFKQQTVVPRIAFTNTVLILVRCKRNWQISWINCLLFDDDKCINFQHFTSNHIPSDILSRHLPPSTFLTFAFEKIV